MEVQMHLIKTKIVVKNLMKFLLAAVQEEGEDIAVSKQQWIQSGPIKGSEVISLLATPEGELYAFADRSIYKLETDGKEWQHIFDTTLLDTYYEKGEASYEQMGQYALSDTVYRPLRFKR